MSKYEARTELGRRLLRMRQRYKGPRYSVDEILEMVARRRAGREEREDEIPRRKRPKTIRAVL